MTRGVNEEDPHGMSDSLVKKTDVQTFRENSPREARSLKHNKK